MTEKELKDECMENAEIDIRRYSNNELTQIREAMRMYADRKLKLFAIPDVNQQREQLLAFCDHLNTYAGMEEIRFDFMMQDFIDKSQ